MTKVLAVYHSSSGHIETMAGEIAAGARAVPGVEVTNKQAPVAKPDELGDYDAIIIGTPTRFGGMSGQMRSFLDQTGGQ